MSFCAGLIRVGLIRPRYCPSATGCSLRLDIRTLSSIRYVPSSLSSLSSTIKEYSLEIKKKPRDPNVIRQYYPALAWGVSQAYLPSSTKPKPGSILSETIFKAILKSLAASGSPKDLSRIDDILSDMTNVFGMPPTSETHTSLIRGLLKTRNTQTILNWFANMPSKPGSVKPTLQHYHMLLEAAPEFASLKVTKNVVQNMRQTGCEPNNETYKILIRVVWKLRSVPPVSDFIPLIQEMKDAGLPYDESVAELLSSPYLVEGRASLAQAVLSAYKETFAAALGTDELLENQWIPRITEAAKKGGVGAGVDAYRDYLSQGGKPSSRVLSSLMLHARTSDQLYRLGDTLGIEPSQEHWSLLIMNNVHAGNLKQAFKIHDHLVELGQRPIPSVVALLLRTLFWQVEGLPSDETVDMALQIYSQFTDALPEKCISLDVDTLRSIVEVYQIILRGVSTSPNQEKYEPIFKSIIEDMKARNIPGQDMTTSFIVMRMRMASSENEAYNKCYKSNSSALDAKGFLTVLDVFARLEFGDVRVPSLPMYFGIVKDMKAAGFNITPKVYTIFLRALGDLVTRASSSAVHYHLVNQIAVATRRVHDLITLDASISPDATLWNQLMDTYQRLGSFADALRVWDQMYLSGRYDHVSVGIILDACGDTGAKHLAEQIVTKLQKSGFKFSPHISRAWIKCLCQLGRLNDALMELCLVMENPDTETANIIIGRVKPEAKEKVMARIQKYKPALYEALIRKM